MRALAPPPRDPVPRGALPQEAQGGPEMGGTPCAHWGAGWPGWGPASHSVGMDAASVAPVRTGPRNRSGIPEEPPRLAVAPGTCPGRSQQSETHSGVWETFTPRVLTLALPTKVAGLAGLSDHRSDGPEASRSQSVTFTQEIYCPRAAWAAPGPAAAP